MDCGITETKGKTETILELALNMQKEHGWVTEQDVREISARKGVPEAKVYETLSFYSMIHLKEPPKVVVEVCRGTSCYIANGADLLEEIKKITNCEIGGYSEDGIYHIQYVECLGHCETAPNILVNGRLYTSVTKETVNSILKEAAL